MSADFEYAVRYAHAVFSVERGFRFLKDPMFFADSLFVKKPERIMALIMIMGLSLLIYALAERELRQQLQVQDETIPNQGGKPTKRVTMRRVAQIFEGVDLLVISVNGQTLERHILNLSELRIKILKLFNPEVQKCYIFPD